MIFGYARVSTEDQNLNLQIDELTQHGIDKLFQEKVTGSKRDRPQLEDMVKGLREGDSVVIYKLDRISRSTKHLIELSETFEELGVNFISIQDNVDTSTSMGRFFFRVMASLAELERDITIERTKSGLEAARARGKKGGRPSKASQSIELALKMYDSKQYSIKQILEASKLSKTTLYRYLNGRKN
ncbi:recombinase family protein [Carnobacterium maltaromaticum]|uniref:recombinase family protein n=1 Tax=Carnobacterium maltaromaticum TaxID=2751 RepID=UPI000E753501|nr:recombinase family protein [Carnobacterium maltaromaticum]AOA04114.1 resolvase [Carnobacterium maltaromaticum]AOA04193.1 resolvase [Carnobacterium maltaromaticum]